MAYIDSTSILRDSSPMDSSYRTSSIVHNPYGLRLTENKDEEFKTFYDALQYIFGTADNVPGSRDLAEWFSIMQDTTYSYGGMENMNGRQDTVDGYGGGLPLIQAPNYTDARIGGNDAINPYWQFDRDDDIVPERLRLDAPGVDDDNYGMGRVYAEKYDSHQQILWLQMGVPEYNSAAIFIKEAGDETAARIMRNGCLRGMVGRFISSAFQAAVWCITLPISLPLTVYRWMRRVSTERITGYYYFRPAMPLYYEMVNSMLSYLAVGMGLYPFVMSERKDANKRESEKMQGWSSGATGAGLNSGRPLFNDSRDIALDGTTIGAETGVPEILKNGPDIFLIMNRRARLFQAAASQVTARELLRISMENDQTHGNTYYHAAPTAYKADENGQIHEVTGNVSDKERDPRFWESLKGNMFGMNDFIGFKIEKGFSPSESVSNSTGELELASKLNSYASQKKEELENSSDSKVLSMLKKIPDGPKQVLTSIGINFASQAISAVGGGDIATVINAGQGFVAMPEVWKSSSFSKSFSFTVQLRARYGDPTSIYQCIYIPLCMLLGAGLPRAVGASMYTSPFLVRAYCKGFFSIPLGIIESMSISRGTGENSWTEDMLPLAVDVNFQIKDLSPVFFLGLQDIGFMDTFRQNTNMIDYLDTLSGLGLAESTVRLQKALRKASAAVLIKKNTTFNPQFYATKIGHTGALKSLAAVLPWTSYSYEAFQQ